MTGRDLARGLARYIGQRLLFWGFLALVVWFSAPMTVWLLMSK